MTEHNQPEARVEFDWSKDVLKIWARHNRETLLLWPDQFVTFHRDVPSSTVVDDFPEGFRSELEIPEDIARAIYIALADYFGHAGHDIRALRRDYEAERGRVDKFIKMLTGQ